MAALFPRGPARPRPPSRGFAGRHHLGQGLRIENKAREDSARPGTRRVADVIVAGGNE